MKLPELLRELRVPFRQHGESPHVSEGWVGIVCPYCDRGRGNFGLGVNLASGVVSCWKCGPHRLSTVLADITGLEQKLVRQHVREVERIRRRLDESAGRRGRLVLPPGIERMGPAHRRYLADRGFDPDVIEEVWKVQGTGISSRLPWRLFIPIHREGEVVSWTTRAVGAVAHANRYRGARRAESVYPRSSLLYGEDYCLHGVVVHEGPADVWATGPGAVCTCGVGFGAVQTARLARFPVRAVCFDNTPAAQRRARALCRQLEPFAGETYNVQVSGPDPAESPRDELLELRRRFLE
jgi:hypothetical protein